jgi:glutamate dehydrogenase/leucine dehydrogenase
VIKSGDVVTLSLAVGGITKTVTTTVNATVNVPTSDLVNDGDKTIVASLAATDAAGNVATAGSITADQLYVVDTLAPANTALRIDAVTADDIINAAEAGLANLPITGKVTGVFAAGDTVTLTINDKPFTGTVDAQGVFSISVPPPTWC